MIRSIVKQHLHSWILLWIPAFMTSSTMTGCTKPEPPGPQPVEVTVAMPEKKDVTNFLDFTGTTEAVESVEIRARVEGFLEAVKFEDSAEVNKGDTLFIIDPREYQAKVDAADAELEKAQADLKNAETTLSRVIKSSESGAVSEREVDLRKAERDMAKAQVTSAEAGLEKAKLELSYTRILSPIDGRVGRDLVTVGNLVGAGEYTLLTKVVKMDPMDVYFDIPEKVLLATLEEKPVEKRGKPLRTVFLGLSHKEDYPFEGVLNYIDNTVDPATGTVRIRAEFSNESQLLYPGLFARIRIPTDVIKDALLVHEEAVGTDLGGKYLLVVSAENIVEHRRVELGQVLDGMQVVLEGLKAEDRYITKGLQRARPGLPVTPLTAEEADQKAEGEKSAEKEQETMKEEEKSKEAAAEPPKE